MRLLLLALVLPLLAACTGSGGSSSSPSPASPPPAATAPPTASAPPVPRNRACYALSYDDAIAPTVPAPPVPCAREHTAMTFAVGPLDTLADGHLLAVDSARVLRQVSTECPARFEAFVGGSVSDRRLSMLRPVWFTPSVEESDAGASWFRCDVVALATEEELAPLTGRLAGVLDTERGRTRYGMCGTARPGTADFSRVVCSRRHSWRAVAVVPFDAGPYPGVSKVRAAGETPCQDAGATAAGGALDYEWGYEWPTRVQWRSGQTFGRCWAPD
ncbi:hypothetical protein GCM10027062_43480 [Nocardioides hungaricus]